ncbi:unnamed protein product [Ceutorhynchus assimilis]|uniref:HMG box domain-containing protein n=1 Tax=Ceutorhynchus assimilis TaxID=467358 RepID=A0A9P0DEY8_9CUCU|nr:unnamed protein product [Ceutorhynchus assimilis]
MTNIKNFFCKISEPQFSHFFRENSIFDMPKRRSGVSNNVQEQKSCPDENPKREQNNNRGVVKSEPSKMIRIGRVTRNPFLNFLREVRKKCSGMGVLEISVKAGELWRKMSRNEKEPFLQMARQAPRRRRRRRRRHRMHRYETDDEGSGSSTECFTKPRRRTRKSRSRSIHKKSRSKSRVKKIRSKSCKKY